MSARILPLNGPLDEDPTGQVHALLDPLKAAGARPPAMTLARGMLDEALTGLPLGDFDRTIVAWLKGWDVPTVATVASLLRRAWQSGASAGCREVVDAQPVVQHLRSTVAALEDDLRDRNARVAELAATVRRHRTVQDDLRAELAAVRANIATDQDDQAAAWVATSSAAVRDLASQRDRLQAELDQARRERGALAERVAELRAERDGEPRDQWARFPADCPSTALRGVWHRDPDGDHDPIPALYVTPGEGLVEHEEHRWSVAEAREFARRLTQAAGLAAVEGENGGDSRG